MQSKAAKSKNIQKQTDRVEEKLQEEITETEAASQLI